MDKLRQDAIIIDIDGTLIDFEKIDNTIIKSLFNESKIVSKLDKLLWKINSFDVIGNSKMIFIIRMAIYSLLSRQNFDSVLDSYGKFYCNLAREEFTNELLNELNFLRDSGYKVFVISRNMYATKLKEELTEYVYYTQNKRIDYPRFFLNYNVKYVVGNNYMDDIAACYLLNRAYKSHNIDCEATAVYIGKSKLVDILLDSIDKRKIFSSCKEFFDYIRHS